MKYYKNFTIVPNELLESSQLSLQSRYLMCVLLKYSGQDETCYPSQQTLADQMGYKSPRHIRTLLNELAKHRLITWKRTGFNKTNTYRPSKKFSSNRNHISAQYPTHKKPSSADNGASVPLHNGNTLPPKTTYRKPKNKNGSSKGMQSLRASMIKKGLLTPNHQPKNH